MAKRSETGIEDMEEVVSRFVDDAEALLQTVDNTTWLAYLKDVIQVSNYDDANSIAFYEQAAAVAQNVIGVTVGRTKTGVTQTRNAAGQPGAGQFVSKDNINERLANFKALIASKR